MSSYDWHLIALTFQFIQEDFPSERTILNRWILRVNSMEPEWEEKEAGMIHVFKRRLSNIYIRNLISDSALSE